LAILGLVALFGLTGLAMAAGLRRQGAGAV
jgi:hypothetical protein